MLSKPQHIFRKKTHIKISFGVVIQIIANFLYSFFYAMMKPIDESYQSFLLVDFLFSY